MARKRRPQIAGTDPAYTSDFTTRLPTNLPPEASPPKPEVQDTKAGPSEKQAPKLPAKASIKARSPDAKKSEPKPSKQPKQAAKAAQQTIKPDPAGQGGKRQVALTSAITVQHHIKLEALAKHGISQKDAMSLAGRRAIDRFEAQPRYIEKPKGDRMPMRQGYKTTKAVDAKLIDALRAKHDPLKLLSDGAMLRGQFEPLFWDCMDEVITELNQRFG